MSVWTTFDDAEVKRDTGQRDSWWVLSGGRILAYCTTEADAERARKIILRAAEEIEKDG